MRTLTPAELELDPQFAQPRRPWQIGVVGLGSISQAHLTAYRAAGWPVVAAAEIDPARRAAAQAEWGIPQVYERWEDLVADPQVEVISLLTQPTLREPVLLAAAAAGKPLQTEKPLAADIPTCERMIAAAAARRLPLAVSQNYRWHPAIFFARQLIARGTIGTPYFAQIRIHGTQDVDLVGNEFYRTCDDFMTVQWNTHLVDLLRCFTGREARRVLARTGRMAGQSFRSDLLLLTIVDFGPGCTGHVAHDELVRSRMQSDECRIEGDGGTIVCDLWGSGLTISSAQLGREPVRVDLSGVTLPHPMAGPMGDFLRAVEDGREPLISARSNLAVVRQVFAEHQSALAGGAWVDLAEG